jgi:hypothetical protein
MARFAGHFFQSASSLKWHRLDLSSQTTLGCGETAAVTTCGLTAVGISVPLGNYHNQDDGTHALAPEYVYLMKVDGMLKLCRALMMSGLPWSTPWKRKRRRLVENLKRYHGLLKTACSTRPDR